MYFSVKKPLKIAGKPYRNCICYECGRELEATIKDLESKGLAKIHLRKVYFCNGVELPDPRKVKRTKTVTKTNKEIKGF